MISRNLLLDLKKGDVQFTGAGVLLLTTTIAADVRYQALHVTLTGGASVAAGLVFLTTKHTFWGNFTAVVHFKSFFTRSSICT